MVKFRAERATEAGGGVELVVKHLEAFYWKPLEPSSEKLKVWHQACLAVGNRSSLAQDQSGIAKESDY